MPGFPILHYLPEFAQTHVHWVSDAIQLSHLLSSPSPSALNLSQNQELFQWVSCYHQMTKTVEIQLHHPFNNGILLSHKKEQNNYICSNMNVPKDRHTEWSKSDKGRQTSYYLWNLKKKKLYMLYENLLNFTSHIFFFMIHFSSCWSSSFSGSLWLLRFLRSFMPKDVFTFTLV